MKKLGFVLFLACGGQAPAVQAPVAANCPIDVAAPASCANGIWGTVGDTAGRNPIAGAQITARHGDEVRTAATGGDGSYILCDLAAGDWDVTFTAGDAELQTPVRVMPRPEEVSLARAQDSEGARMWRCR